MRISQVRVQHFRCIDDLTVDVDTLTAIVGSGGAGKSSFLRALEWFFAGGQLDQRDVRDGSEQDDVVSVAVTFSDLNDDDRDRLGKYAVGETTTLTRTWRPGEADKLSGSALVFPEFDEIRQVAGVERRQRFASYLHERGERIGLAGPAPTRVADADEQMEQWERGHPDQCVVRTADARHLFGIVGDPRLADRFDFVLIGASDDAGETLDTHKTSALGRLLASVIQLDDATADQVAALQAEANEKIQAVISEARADSLTEIAGAISARVQQYVTGIAVRLTPEMIAPRAPGLSVDVLVEDQVGHATDVGRQGHGIQRALVIGLLHEIAERSVSGSNAAGAPDGQQSPATLMLAIEEPELYQHPLQARSLAETLVALAERPQGSTNRSVQIVYSTHSPHFVRPAEFERLRVFRRGASGATEGVAADTAKVAQVLDTVGMNSSINATARRTLSSTLAEAVFARGVVLCEGTSDAAWLEAVARLSGGFDRDGIAVVTAWGKTVIPLALAILRQLDIPTYVLFDGDAGLEDRLKNKPTVTEVDRASQLRSVTTKNRQLLELCGVAPVDWPERTVRQHCANFRDRLEDDLNDIWPSLTATRAAISTELGISAKSDEVYRRAVQEAANPPTFVDELVAAIRDHVGAM